MSVINPGHPNYTHRPGPPQLGGWVGGGGIGKYSEFLQYNRTHEPLLELLENKKGLLYFYIFVDKSNIILIEANASHFSFKLKWIHLF